MPESHLTEEERKRIRDLEVEIARINGVRHAENNAAQRDIARERLTPKTPDVPLWLKITGAALMAVVALSVLGGTAATVIRQDAAMVARVAALEAKAVELGTIPARVTAIETSSDTGRRIRDQQQQGMNDQIRALQLSDQAGNERLNSVLQSLATITAQLQAQAVRTEEVLRRQDRLENRLGRMNAPQPEENPTSFQTLRLVYRVR